MYDEINTYFDYILSKFQYSAQHCLLIEKIRTMRDSKGVFAAALTVLSEAFDCISQVLLLAKLQA